VLSLVGEPLSGKRVWFTESHIIFVISFLFVALFTQFILDKLNTGLLNQVHHHHVQEGLGLIPVPCILKMKLVPPSLPWSSYVSSSFWFIL